MISPLALIVIGGMAHAQQDDFSEGFGVPPQMSEPRREPASNGVRKRSRPNDEEDLRVQTTLPEAEIKADARTLQRDVYKSVYNQELKEERHDDAEE